MPDQKRSSNSSAISTASPSSRRLEKINVQEISDAASKINITNWTTKLASLMRCRNERSEVILYSNQHMFRYQPRLHARRFKTGDTNTGTGEDFVIGVRPHDGLIENQTGRFDMGDPSAHQQRLVEKRRLEIIDLHGFDHEQDAFVAAQYVLFVSN